MTACSRVVLVCTGLLFPGQKAYHCRDRRDLEVEDSTQDDACEEARKMISTEVVTDNAMSEPPAPRHNLLSNLSVEVVLGGGSS